MFLIHWYRVHHVECTDRFCTRAEINSGTEQSFMKTPGHVGLTSSMLIFNLFKLLYNWTFHVNTTENALVIEWYFKIEWWTCTKAVLEGRVSEIGCPGARDTCLTAVDEYLPHISCLPGIHPKWFAAAVHQRSVGDGQPVFLVGK
jgi:hypothetical protein